MKLDPKIEDARRFAKRWGKAGVVIFFLDKDGLGYASYGQNRDLCNHMRAFADRVIEGENEGAP